MDTGSLPVYNAARRLLDQFELSTKKRPINIKRGSVAKVEEWLIEILDGIMRANETTENPTDKVRFINESIEKLRTVMIRVRTLQSIHVIHKKGFGAIVREEANVARQLKGWAKKTMSDA